MENLSHCFHPNEGGNEWDLLKWGSPFSVYHKWFVSLNGWLQLFLSHTHVRTLSHTVYEDSQARISPLSLPATSRFNNLLLSLNILQLQSLLNADISRCINVKPIWGGKTLPENGHKWCCYCFTRKDSDLTQNKIDKLKTDVCQVLAF